jgi:hypothetical protein
MRRFKNASTRGIGRPTGNPEPTIVTRKEEVNHG